MDVERNGYIFDGWYQDANFQTPANKNEAGDYIYQNSKTYYAKWVYNITFDANGGEGTMEAQAVTEGDQTTKLMNSTLPEPTTPVPDGIQNRMVRGQPMRQMRWPPPSPTEPPCTPSGPKLVSPLHTP